MLTYAKEKICGATIMSTGMARAAGSEHHEEISFRFHTKYLNSSEKKEQNHSNCNSLRPAGNYHS